MAFSGSGGDLGAGAFVPSGAGPALVAEIVADSSSLYDINSSTVNSIDKKFGQVQ